MGFLPATAADHENDSELGPSLVSCRFVTAGGASGTVEPAEASPDDVPPDEVPDDEAPDDEVPDGEVPDEPPGPVDPAPPSDSSGLLAEPPEQAPRSTANSKPSGEGRP